jgi:hypothetical protein
MLSPSPWGKLMESQEPYENSEGRMGNKQTNANLPNDNDSAASLVQLQLSNIFSLGYLPTYLPTTHPCSP